MTAVKKPETLTAYLYPPVLLIQQQQHPRRDTATVAKVTAPGA